MTGRLRGRARLPRRDMGAVAGRPPPARRSCSRSRRRSPRSSACSLAGDRLGWVGWTGCAVMLAGIVLAEPAAAATLRRLVAARPRLDGRRPPRARLGGAASAAMTVAVRFGARPRRAGRRRGAAHAVATLAVLCAAAALQGGATLAGALPVPRSPALLAPGLSRSCSSPRDSRGRAVARLGRVRDGAALRGDDRRALPRRAARRRGRSSGRCSIVVRRSRCSRSSATVPATSAGSASSARSSARRSSRSATTSSAISPWTPTCRR